jgi:methyltransferase
MTLIPHWLIGLVAIQRLLELALSRRNAARLLSRGGYEVLTPADADVSLPWLASYLVLQCGRAWVMLTLGPYWTTRVIHLPTERLVSSGPYRFCSHPNYVVVAGEIAVLPLVFGQWYTAAAFSILNALLLVWRIRVENAALAMRSAKISSPRSG